MISKVLAVLCVFVAVIQASVDTEQQTDGLTSLPEALLSRSRRSCGPRECNDHCKRLGHARGVCIGTYCQCRSRLRRSLENDTVYNNEDDFEIREVAPMVNDGEISETSAEVNSFADVAKSRSARGTCGYDECNRFCRKLGHARGVCIGNYCQCRFRRRRSVTQELERENIDVKSETNQNADEKLIANIPGVSRRVCFEAECSSHCRNMGYVRGVCIGTRCQCRAQ